MILAFALGFMFQPDQTTDDEPLNITISEIRADPWKYHEKLVRVQGIFDDCRWDICRICEDQDALISRTQERCMEVEFQTLATSGNTRDEDQGLFVEDALTRLQQERVRFSSAAIDGIFDATCSIIEDPIRIPICLPSDLDLFVTNVVSVEKYSSASDGFISLVGIFPITAANETDSVSLRSSFQKQRSRSLEPDVVDSFAFLHTWQSEDSLEAGIEAEGGLCFCRYSICSEDDWPKLGGQTWISSPATLYRCWQAEKINGEWFFPIQ